MPVTGDRGSYTEIEHTADLGLDLRGATPAAVLEAAQRGTVAVLFGREPPWVPTEEVTIRISAESRPELLKQWCEKIYDLLEEGFVAITAAIESGKPEDFRAVVRGARPPASAIAEASEMKAVTWHELAFEPTSVGWRARVIFDV